MRIFENPPHPSLRKTLEIDRPILFVRQASRPSRPCFCEADTAEEDLYGADARWQSLMSADQNYQQRVERPQAAGARGRAAASWRDK